MTSTTTTLCRFTLTGLAATLLHVVTATSLIEAGHWAPGWANGAAFLLANVVSYALHSRWTFGSGLSLATWRRFILVSIAAWALTVSISSAVATLGGHYLLGIALVTTIVPALSFLAHRCFTYRQPPPRSPG